MKLKNIDFVQTDFICFNEMTGGGIPRGKIIELCGEPGTGKTTFALEISKLFRKTLYLDYEGELDPVYIDGIGAKVDIEQPLFFEEGVDMFFKKTLEAVKNKKRIPWDLLIIDSIGSALTKYEFNQTIESDIVGKKAAKISQWARKQKSINRAAGVTCLALNHWKEGIGAFAKNYTPGGRELFHQDALKILFGKGKSKVFVDADSQQVDYAGRCYMRLLKNKITGDIGNVKCEYEVIRGKGFSRGVEYLAIAVELGMIEVKGHVYIVGDDKFKGIKNIVNHLDENIELQDKIYERWMARNC